MQRRSASSRQPPHSSRRYAPSYTENPYNTGEETHYTTQPGVSAVSNDFSNASLSFAPHEPLNYAPDLNHGSTWSTDNTYSFSDNHGSANEYGLGYSNVGGPSSDYYNPAGPSTTYGEHVTESSEQDNMYSVYQPSQHVPDSGFDLAPFELPQRTYTSAPAPISSADMFDGTTVPLIFEDTISDPQFSPTASRSSRSSFDTAWSPSASMIPQMESHAEMSYSTQPGSSSAQPTSLLSPDTSSAKPYRCSQPGCTRSYARKFELYRHQRRHTGVKSHHCQVPGCDRGPNNGFYRKDHLHQHMRQVHNA